MKYRTNRSVNTSEVPEIPSEVDALSRLARIDPLENRPPQVPFYEHWGRASDKFANASLASSRTLLDGVSIWSKNTGREGLHVMRFGSEWRNPRCTVERWYQAQVKRSQESESTTHFTTIQHRRNLDAPFYHEFLLIPLKDGSCYRLERTGVGSNVDAISLSGCAACNLIQWFPGDEYRAFVQDKPSALVASVQFPREFDILDVLAVCYSIQQHPDSRNYTLQCYNCYFFCCAILAVLARRVADWESVVFFDQWGGLVEKVLDRISESASRCSQPDGKRYYALRACSILGDENLKSILNELRVVLVTGSNGFERFRISLGYTLWWFNFGASIKRDLGILVEIAAEVSYVIHSDALGAKAPGLVQPSGSTAENHDGHNLFFSVRSKEDVDVWSKRMLALRRQILPLANVKRQLPFSIRAMASMCGPIRFIHHRMAETHEFEELRGLGRLQFMARIVTSAPSVGPAEYLVEKTSHGKNISNACNEYATSSEGFRDIANAALCTLESKGTSNANDVLEAYQVLMHEGSWDCWEHSIEELLSDTLEAVVKAEALDQRNVVILARPSMGGEEVSIFDFQDHIRAHIRAYADRVGRHKLGSPALVCSQAEDVISDVWRRVPEGYGVRMKYEREPVPTHDYSRLGSRPRASRC
ncbi:hypothetical protein FRC06_002868 [Ceratobasidium sp. 370]|nr:hypothetical protein FRC06_002868 [Ceratobasidium sp. 370]